jgi:hypothetical protein
MAIGRFAFCSKALNLKLSKDATRGGVCIRGLLVGSGELSETVLLKRPPAAHPLCLRLGRATRLAALPDSFSETTTTNRKSCRNRPGVRRKDRNALPALKSEVFAVRGCERPKGEAHETQRGLGRSSAAFTYMACGCAKGERRALGEVGRSIQ